MNGLKDLRVPLRLSNMMRDAGFVDVSVGWRNQILRQNIRHNGAREVAIIANKPADWCSLIEARKVPRVALILTDRGKNDPAPYLWLANR